ncbi:MAG: glycosyltransferase [Vicinamibacterales bacterium]
MRVLHAVAYFAPAFGYGGPVRSLLRLCQALSAEGVAQQVFTTTADGNATLPPAPGGREYGGLTVRYFPRAAFLGGKGLGAALAGAARDADVVHVHGLWNATVWAAARGATAAGVPYLLSPRGMLLPAALGHDRTRKRLSWLLNDRRVVARAAAFHATSAQEADVLRRYARGRDIATIPNGVDIPPQPASAPWPSGGPAPGVPYVAMLGRLHPIKRLDLAIEAFRRLRARRPDVCLVIAGPDEAGLRQGFEAAGNTPATGVHWLGMVDDAARTSLLAHARALVMCSDSESFGMSAAEAMAAGVPVVITRTCPWAGVETEGAGAFVPQRADAVADALEALLQSPEGARAAGARGRLWMQREFDWGRIAVRMSALYARLAAGDAGLA